tara:strand:+ start:337 stop:531 length:195 start_codon:yes stop_codon:yes gene_type:complete
MKPINIKKKININIGSSTTNGKGKKFIFTISLLLIENKEQKIIRKQRRRKLTIFLNLFLIEFVF